KSYEGLEVLLLFAREGGTWTPEAVAADLRVALTSINEAVDGFCAAGLLLRDDGVQGHTVRRHPAAEDMLHGLQDAYRENRIELMGLMTRHAMERVRTSALRAFAAAFELGKKHDG